MASLTLRPNGVGTYTAFQDEFPDTSAHWSVVDEAVANSDTDYIIANLAGTEVYDSFTLENHTSETGVINSVTVYYASKYVTLSGQCRPFLRLSGTDSLGTLVAITSAYVERSEVISRPGGGSWSWADIDALEVGIGGKPGTASTVRPTQVYVVVDYTPAAAGGPKQTNMAAKLMAAGVI